MYTISQMAQSAVDQSLFWDLVLHQSPLHQSLAKVSLGSLVKRLEACRIGRFASLMRGAFDRWSLAVIRITKAESVTRADELLNSNAALEQRYSSDTIFP